MDKHVIIAEILDQLATQKSLIIRETEQAWLQCNFNLSEPELVKSFALEQGKGVDYLNKNVAKVINSAQGRFAFKFAGIYTHQRPYIMRWSENTKLHPSSNKSNKCELSDLMLLAVIVDQDKEIITSRATFFQAKKDDKINNNTQQYLYDFDNGFDYASPSFWQATAKASPERELPAWDDERSTAFQYLILRSTDRRAKLTPWKIDHSHGFGFYFYRLLTMATGKLYLDKEKASGGWSSIVNDALRMGNGKMGGKNRGSFDLDKLVDHFNSFKDHDNYFYDSGEKEGFPIILAIIQDTENKVSNPKS